MLKSYQAIYERGSIRWLFDQPQDETAQIIVTVLNQQVAANASQIAHKNRPSARIAGCGRILGDIVEPVAEASDWDVLK